MSSKTHLLPISCGSTTSPFASQTSGARGYRASERLARVRAQRVAGLEIEVECPKIADLVCFYSEHVDITIDEQAMPRPFTPWSDDPTA